MRGLCCSYSHGPWDWACMIFVGEEFESRWFLGFRQEIVFGWNFVGLAYVKMRKLKVGSRGSLALSLSAERFPHFYHVYTIRFLCTKTVKVISKPK